MPLVLEGHRASRRFAQSHQPGGSRAVALWWPDQCARLCLELQLPGPSTAHAVRPLPLSPDCLRPGRALMARAPRPAFTMLLRGSLPPVVSAVRLPRSPLLCRRPQGLVPCLPQGLCLICHHVLKTDGWTPGPAATLTPSSTSLNTPASGRRAAQHPALGGQEPMAKGSSDRVPHMGQPLTSGAHRHGDLRSGT